MDPVFLPILDANMTHGIIRAWLKSEGEAVRAGEPLFEVETDKVNAEVEAESSGVLRIVVVPEGEKVEVRSLLAFIGADDEPLPPRESWTMMAPSPEEAMAEPEMQAPPLAAAPAASGRRLAASPAARRLARERGIDLERLTPSGPRGEITVADVERAEVAPATSGASVAAPSGDVDPGFLDSLRRDLGAFRALSSESKIRLYREHGAHIGEGVRLESGAIIVAEHIDIGGQSAIGADSTIECSRFRLGRLSVLGRRAKVKCLSVEIGDALWAKDDVVIGGGGANEPGARLYAGDACFFGEAAYLNAGEPIRLGDEVCIGSRAMLFTHSHWQSVLRGHTSRFGAIEVGDHVFIGNNAFVFPGVRIGSEATVMVNSFVGVHVPAQAFVGGVPARVLRHVTPPPRAEQQDIMRREFDVLLPTLAAHGFPGRRRDDGEALVIDLDGASIRFEPVWPGRHRGEGRTIVLTFADGDLGDRPAATTIFDLAGSRVAGPQDAVTDEVREFCRRRGIRLRPFAWRYRVGHFEGDIFVPRR